MCAWARCVVHMFFTLWSCVCIDTTMCMHHKALVVNCNTMLTKAHTKQLHNVQTTFSPHELHDPTYSEWCASYIQMQPVVQCSPALMFIELLSAMPYTFQLDREQLQLMAVGCVSHHPPQQRHTSTTLYMHWISICRWHKSGMCLRLAQFTTKDCGRLQFQWLMEMCQFVENGS